MKMNHSGKKKTKNIRTCERLMQNNKHKRKKKSTSELGELLSFNANIFQPPSDSGFNGNNELS